MLVCRGSYNYGLHSFVRQNVINLRGSDNLCIQEMFRYKLVGFLWKFLDNVLEMNTTVPDQIICMECPCATQAEKDDSNARYVTHVTLQQCGIELRQKETHS